MSDKNIDKLKHLFSMLKNALLEHTMFNAKKIITDIEKLLDIKYLKDQLILPGGICTHEYHYAISYIENYKDINVSNIATNDIVDKFGTSVYDDINNYCKVCGGILYNEETDDASNIFTSASYQEYSTSYNYINTLIWRCY